MCRQNPDAVATGTMVFTKSSLCKLSAWSDGILHAVVCKCYALLFIWSCVNSQKKKNLSLQARMDFLGEVKYAIARGESKK